MDEARPVLRGTRVSPEPDTASAGSPHGRRGRPELSALYRRAADTLDRSAELAECNAERVERRGQEALATIERERAMRAREAARRGRALASQLQ